MTWTLEQIPPLAGKQMLVTGVTSGIGTHTARELAARGATVILAARSANKLAATRAALSAELPQATFHDLLIDLSEMSSVRRAADQAREFGAIDVLVNNAGVMGAPYTRTGDNFELQMATNHFGPFLLTGLLLDQLAASGDGRVVAVASLMHRFARKAPLGEPRRSEGSYRRWDVYAESKLANLLFTFELERRLRAANLPVKAVAAHPGYSATGLTGSNSIMDAFTKAVAQPARMGAWPSLMAATADIPGGTYIGPDSLGQTRGNPKVVGCSALARDTSVAAQLWDVSEQATGIAYP